MNTKKIAKLLETQDEVRPFGTSTFIRKYNDTTWFAGNSEPQNHKFFHSLEDAVKHVTKLHDERVIEGRSQLCLNIRPEIIERLNDMAYNRGYIQVSGRYAGLPDVGRLIEELIIPTN